MSQRIIIIVLMFSVFSACKNNAVTQVEHSEKHSLISKLEDTDFTIAFGSCSHEDDPQPLWNHIMQEEADLWIWLGDAIYGDTENMDEFSAKFKMQNHNPDYQKFKQSIDIIGIWDDHDYGDNDAGKEYPLKKETQKLFLQFLDAGEDDPRWSREGIYRSHNITHNGIDIKILLLDTRYFRDALVGRSGAYGQNLTGTILGDAQWLWLEDELKNSEADVHIFGSSIQLIAEEQGWEKWSNFPNEKLKMLNLLKQMEISTPIFISGDRHAAEISIQEHEGIQIYDITSSGLTSVVKRPKPETNRFRLSGTEKCYTPNYGLLHIASKDSTSLTIQTELKTGNTSTVMRHNLGN